MFRRLALPIGVVLLLVAIVLVSLQLGYLGRRAGGPLVAPAGFDPAPLRARPDRWAVAVERYRVDGGRVRITDARPVLASPGMRIRGPRLTAVPRARFRARDWPARGDQGRATGIRLRGAGDLALGVRLRRPGTYFVWRYAFDYEQGARSYRRTTSAAAPLCVNLRSVCPARARLPDPARFPLADIGGPSRYPVRLRGNDPPRARVPARAGTSRLTVTLSNRTADRIAVRDLRLDPVAYGAFSLRSAFAPAFALAAGASRTVTLDLTGTGCQAADPGAASGTDRLTATIDGDERAVPLMATLAPVPAPNC